MESSWSVHGARLDAPPLRIYLAGRLTVESANVLVRPEQFPGQQGRTAFAHLTLERGRPVTHAELAEVVWPGDLPPAWGSALSAIVSKLRALLAKVSPGAAALVGARGCWELTLPADAWIDVEAAADAIHDAECALRAGDVAQAYGPSAVALHIARRPFLPGERGSWIESRRDRLRAILLRALEARSEVYLANGEHALALQTARDLVALEPFRESGHRLVMRALAAGGNVAEALRAYEDCRRRIARELGVDPSPQTKSLHDRLLRSL